MFKILHSSGTTGQTPSRIVLDREDGPAADGRAEPHHDSRPRSEPLADDSVESPDLIQNRQQFNARAAGLLGMIHLRQQTLLRA